MNDADSRAGRRPLFPIIAIVSFISAAGRLPCGDPIVADHSIVADYAIIPQAYIDSVKKMLVDVPGESHSSGYRIGCQLLEDMDARFQVNIDVTGAPETYTDQYMRLTNATWGDVTHATGWIHGYGEEDWYTSDTAVLRTKAHLSYCDTTVYEIRAMGFGWCWDMTWHNSPGGGTDPVYQVRWAGSSVGGPDGDLRWGLDAGDSALTGNRVCMQTYLDATADYSAHCENNCYPTEVFFTTGPVDGGGNTGESGYQRSLKHDCLRDYVAATDSGVLFDYADILCWSNGGALETRTWTDYGGVPRTFPYIHTDNMLDLDSTYTEDGDHIGQRGALRLAKALWWMLARIAGWDGEPAGIETGSGEKPVTAPRLPAIFRGDLPLPANVACEVYDVSGRPVRIRDMAPGIYFVKLGGSFVQKVAKIR